MPGDARERSLEVLTRQFGARVAVTEAIRQHHGRDESGLPPAAPRAVLFPEDADDAAAMVMACGKLGMPIIPFGAGSGQEGGVNAAEGGVAISTRNLNQITAVKPADFDVEVEAGVTRLALDRALRHTGLFFPVDPGADATLGGMAATGAAGTTTPRYGTMRENVLGLDVVLADGTRLVTGSRARKSSSGYDLTRLFVGSEGTLGLITRLRLRLHPRPAAIVALAATFRNVGSGVEAITDALASGLAPARAEIMDGLSVAAVSHLLRLERPPLPVVLLEFHGFGPEVCEIASAATELCREHGATGIDRATAPEERARIWRMRHAAGEAESLLRPGARPIVTDVAVPLSALAPLMLEAAKRLEAAGLLAPMVGHLADGNFHFTLLVSDDSEAAAAQEFKRWLATEAVTQGGAISGEHGIGIGKRGLLRTTDSTGVAVMRQIKSALDPTGLFNPGKLV